MDLLLSFCGFLGFLSVTQGVLISLCVRPHLCVYVNTLGLNPAVCDTESRGNLRTRDHNSEIILLCKLDNINLLNKITRYIPDL